jgi:hypothetical protein
VIVDDGGARFPKLPAATIVASPVAGAAVNTISSKVVMLDQSQGGAVRWPELRGAYPADSVMTSAPCDIA